MPNIHQIRPVTGHLVHSHSITTSGNLLDHTSDGNGWFFAQSDGSIDFGRITGQIAIIDDGTTASGVASFQGVEHLGGLRHLATWNTTGIARRRLGLWRDKANVLIEPFFSATSIEIRGLTHDQRNSWTGFYQSLSPFANRVFYARIKDPSKSISTILNRSPTFANFAFFEIRGLAFEGRNMWILYKEGAVMKVDYCRLDAIGKLASAQVFRLVETFNMSSLNGLTGTSMYGLFHDGRDLYLGDRG